ncbi:tRNA glutamyl-Q(34) synthetase GluQRS [Pseudoalteromonas sp. McH1-42]|uniref:tRNA glutamyl-Q(34) synthetase GluQRS n=1 Tax=Pseudoalteromonas sp. McH1-42 TaxID=2917752 RepID=UPI001EF52E58|nr:tRNA glutamyl-Q(34) synthetase GluQRS [Pseudoalteromonas sp. McH1-42]MCG7562738.1 tRNA glutamyl-Q(34) synthetase GluQRS [Pseudoalteromonas sp. McH1-42]
MLPQFNSDYLSGSYRGRFAPSPSGALHFGSLIAALASYLDAKINHGQWLVRMEDIDTPRVVAGAADEILRTLDAYGLHWDGEVVYQSQRHDLYQDVLAQLSAADLIYPCSCTRKALKQRGGIYDNHCRARQLSPEGNALRLTQTQPVYSFTDLLQGEVQLSKALAEEDYIVKRRDDLFAYQLVVVVDDIDQQITRIVRGADLLEPTARQISLFTQLIGDAPDYAHVSLAVAQPGFKLSKQNHAPAIDNTRPQPALCAALRFLGLPVPDELQHDSVPTILRWAEQQFTLQALPRHREIQVSLLNDGHYDFTRLTA